MERYMRDLLRRLYPYDNYAVGSNAPETFAGLKELGFLWLFGGNCDVTIFGDPCENIRFRAWHDSLHLGLNSDTSREGEYNVACEHRRIMSHYSEFAARLVFADIWGQVLYWEHWHDFPIDQKGFALDYALHGGVAVQKKYH